MENFYRNKNVLVAGGTGVIGTPLVRRLVSCGAKVTVASLDSEELARRRIGEQPRFLCLDLTKLDACLEATADQDFVFNMVGIKGSVGIGESKVASFFVSMLRFQTNLMDAAFQNKISRFLFVSSVCAYPQSTLHVEDNMWSGMPKQNDRFPGIAKRVGEIQGETYRLEHGWDAVRIVRPSNVYGPYDDFNPATAQVIPALIARMASGQDPIQVWGDGSAIRDFIYSDDVAYWCLVALSKAPACYPINLGCGKGATIREIAEIVASCMPQKPKIEWDTTKPVGDPVRLMSVERAINILGYHHVTPLEHGIRQTVDWYLANR